MSDKSERVGEIIRAVTAEYVRNNANTNPLITITRVVVAPRSRLATIFFTTIPDNKEKDAEVFLVRHAKDVREALKKETRLKFLPHIEFKVDYGERHRQNLDEKINELS